MKWRVRETEREKQIDYYPNDGNMQLMDGKHF